MTLAHRGDTTDATTRLEVRLRGLPLGGQVFPSPWANRIYMRLNQTATRKGLHRSLEEAAPCPPDVGAVSSPQVAGAGGGRWRGSGLGEGKEAEGG